MNDILISIYWKVKLEFANWNFKLNSNCQQKRLTQVLWKTWIPNNGLTYSFLRVEAISEEDSDEVEFAGVVLVIPVGGLADQVLAVHPLLLWEFHTHCLHVDDVA